MTLIGSRIFDRQRPVLLLFFGTVAATTASAIDHVCAPPAFLELLEKGVARETRIDLAAQEVLEKARAYNLFDFRVKPIGQTPKAFLKETIAARPQRYIYFAFEDEVLGIRRTILGQPSNTENGILITQPDGYKAAFDISVFEPGWNATDLYSVEVNANSARLLPSQPRLKHPLIDQDAKARLPIMRQAIKDRQLFSEAYFRHFDARLDKVERLIRRLYPNDDSTLLLEQAKKRMGAKHLAAFLHPGIAKRWRQFVPFAEQKLAREPGLSTYSLYKGFEQKLGTRTVYRAMRLTEAEYAEIMKNGLTPKALIKESHGRQALQNLHNEWNRENTALIDEDISARLTGGYIGEDSFVLSTTDYPELANSVGYWYQRAVNEDKKLYSFKAEVPALNFLNLCPQHEKVLRIGNGPLISNRDPGLERVSFFAIPREQIKEAHEVKEIPPRFEWTWISTHGPKHRPPSF